MPAGGGPCRSGRRTTPSRHGTTSSSRPAPRAGTTGPRCPTPTATRRRPGDSCPEGWRDLHPQLAHYQTWDSGRDVHRDRHHRRLERRERQLRRLAAVERRPVGVGRLAGRGLHRVRQRLGDPGPRRLRRRHRRVDRRGEHVVRERPGRLGPGPQRAAPRTPTTGSGRTSPASRSATRSPRRAPCSWASASRASPVVTPEPT